MKKLKLLAAVSVLLSLGACATVTRGSSTSWTVETTPSAAKVTTTLGFACEATPCTFKVPRKSVFGVTITKSGYKTWQGQVVNKVSGAGGAGMAGNVLVGGLIGIGVDAASGATLDLVPNPLKVNLEPSDSLASNAQSTAAPAN